MTLLTSFLASPEMPSSINSFITPIVAVLSLGISNWLLITEVASRLSSPEIEEKMILESSTVFVIGPI